MTQEQRINSEIEAASKRIDAAYADDPRGRIDAAYADDPRGRIDAYLRIAWIVAHCPSDSLVELVVSCFPTIQQ